MTAHSTIEQLLQHRSIRRFSGQPIAPELLERIIASGQAASTSSFSQSTSVIRVTDRALRSQLNEWSGNQPYIQSAAEFLVFCADLHRAHEVIRRSGADEAALEEAFGWSEQLLTAVIDASLFAQNCAVAAESEGLGICYIGGIRNDIERVSEALALPDLVVPLFGLCIGYPDQAPILRPRLPMSSVLFENHYQLDESDRWHDLKAYDAHVLAYYRARTGGKVEQTWSEQIIKQSSRQTRPHIQAFLKAKGMALK